ncbi:glycosyltransferase, partial [Schumannella luteola]
AILERFAETARARGIRVVLERNPAPLGVTANFERAIRATTGGIVVLCDQDDVWHPERIAVAREAYRADPELLFLHGDAVVVDGAGDADGTTLFARLEVSSHEADAVRRGDAFPVYLRRNLATGAASSFRRPLLDDALPFPAGWLHDEWLATLAAARGGLRIDDRALIDYRVHGGNQVGAAAPTLRHKISRVVDTDAERNALLAQRADELAERLAARGLPAPLVERSWRKARFERARAALPRHRWARAPRVVGWLLTGEYRALASRGSWDAVRDLLRR